MRLRIQPEAARERLAADFEACGGQARTSGETLHLSYPVEDPANHDQGLLELVFFVRAWLSVQPEVEAEVLA